MRIKKRLRIATLISPILLLGVMVQPAQAATPHSKSCSQTYKGVLYTGTVYFSDTNTPLVSYKIITHNSGTPKNSASVAVQDYGVMPARRYATYSAKQDGIWHAIQGPYNRGGGTVAFQFTFVDPTGQLLSGCKSPAWSF